MSDLPGPEKPIDSPVEVGNVNDMLAAYRRQLSTGLAKRERPNGAGGHGQYDGRSGRFLKGKVRARHLMVVNLQAAGWKNDEIAKAMGYTPARVSVILNSKHPELIKARKDMLERVANNTADLSAKFALHAPDALKAMVDVMESNDLAQKRLAARDILDRAGYTPVKKVAIASTSVPFEQLNEEGLLERIKRANEVVLNREQWEVRTA